MTENQAITAAITLSVVANAMRIRMIQTMAEGELRVGDLADRIGLSQSATSQHLGKLKAAGILVQRRNEQSRYCTVSPQKAAVLHKLISVAEAHRVKPSGKPLKQ